MFDTQLYGSKIAIRKDPRLGRYVGFIDQRSGDGHDVEQAFVDFVGGLLSAELDNGTVPSFGRWDA